MFRVKFRDDSAFELLPEWESIFIDYYGRDTGRHARLAERLKFLVDKYAEHQAWPSKFDGIGIEEAGDEHFDDPDFYFEHWDEWGTEGKIWGKRKIQHPTLADLAEAALYQEMRSGILQKALNKLAEKSGQPAPSVMTPEQFLDLLDKKED